jgi:hypothetical protein
LNAERPKDILRKKTKGIVASLEYGVGSHFVLGAVMLSCDAVDFLADVR